MIEIDRILLRLPAGYEQRAANVAHELAAALATLCPASAVRIEQLSPPPVSIGPAATDREIGQALARAVWQNARREGLA